MNETALVIDWRKKIFKFEQDISNMPGAMQGDCFPLEHAFANGMYMRTITVPKGALLVGKIHKHDHPSFMLKGDVSIFLRGGIKRVKAPFSMISKAGDKRLGYVHEEMVWVDVFKTEVTDLAKIEQECVAESFEAFDAYEAKQIKETYFRELTQRVIEAEIPGFFSDWTIEQRELYSSGDWKAFSRSRGYTEEQIAECEEWQDIIKQDKTILLCVKDLVNEAALKNIRLDKNNEILKSSHLNLGGVLCHS